MKKKDPSQRVAKISVSVSPEKSEALEKNILRIQDWLMSNGIKKELVERIVNRSSVVDMVLDELTKESGYLALKSGFSLAFGISSNGQ